MKTGAELIADERKRQIEKEGWTVGHDEKHVSGELSMAAACYAGDASSNIENLSVGCVANFNQVWTNWPFHESWWKPTPNDPVRQLVKAGALIAAEIDRLQDVDG